MRLLFILISILHIVSALAQTKGVVVKTKTDVNQQKDALYVNSNERLALVIGNAEYVESRLTNPVHDAEDVATLLKKYGFKVMFHKNLEHRSMNEVVNKFSDSLRSSKAISLFYFSGHGLQYNSANYLLPLQASLTSEKDIPLAALSLNTVLNKIPYMKKGLNIVILDACRNSPFYKTFQNIPKGLTQEIQKTKNTLIFFATSSDDVAEDGEGHNSPFTEALIDVVSKNDTLELMQVAKLVTRAVEEKTQERQVPQYIGSFTGDFYFRKKEIKKPSLHILSIGVSQYEELEDLKFGASDAIAFAKAFEGQYKVYDTITSHLLTNEHAKGISIYKSLHTIKAKAKPGDVILVYFNGHVVSMEDDIYLRTSNAAYGDKAFAYLDGSISQHQLLNVLGTLPCKSLVFLEATESDHMVMDRLLHEMNRPRNNILVISAGSQPKIDGWDSNKNGVFIQAIVKGLREAVSKDNPGYVDVDALCEYIVRSVPEQTSSRQYPVRWFPNGWQNFILASPENR